MIYTYISNISSYNYFIFIILIILFIGNSFNKLNIGTKGILGIIIGIFIAWILIDYNITIVNNKKNAIKNMVNKSYLLKNLEPYEKALVIYYNSLGFSKYNITEYKNSIKYYLEMMKIYNILKENNSIYYQNKLNNKYLQCINSFKSLELTIDNYYINNFYNSVNKLNKLLLNYIDECIKINNKDIEENGYNIFKKKLYKDPKEYNYNENYSNNMI